MHCATCAKRVYYHLNLQLTRLAQRALNAVCRLKISRTVVTRVKLVTRASAKVAAGTLETRRRPGATVEFTTI